MEYLVALLKGISYRHAQKEIAVLQWPINKITSYPSGKPYMQVLHPSFESASSNYAKITFHRICCCVLQRESISMPPKRCVKVSKCLFESNLVGVYRGNSACAPEQRTLVTVLRKNSLQRHNCTVLVRSRLSKQLIRYIKSHTDSEVFRSRSKKRRK